MLGACIRKAPPCRSSKDGLCNGLKIRGFPIVTGGRHEQTNGLVMELADILDLESSAQRRVSSNLTKATRNYFV